MGVARWRGYGISKRHVFLSRDLKFVSYQIPIVIFPSYPTFPHSSRSRFSTFIHGHKVHRTPQKYNHNLKLANGQLQERAKN